MRAFTPSALLFILTTSIAAAQGVPGEMDVTTPTEEMEVALDTAIAVEEYAGHDYHDELACGEHDATALVPLTPAMIEARMELKAELDAWTCREVSPVLRHARTEFDAVMEPDDRALIDGIRKSIAPILDDFFATHASIGEAREKGDDEAWHAGRQRLNDMEQHLRNTFEPLSDRFEKYSERFSEIFTTLEMTWEKAGWREQSESLVEGWKERMAGSLSEEERDQVIVQCKSEWGERFMMMLTMLPLYESCALDQPNLIFPEAVNGETELK